jgi:hypothetical protein
VQAGERPLAVEVERAMPSHLATPSAQVKYLLALLAVALGRHGGGYMLATQYENPVPAATWWLHEHPETKKPGRKTGPSR